MMRGTVWDAAGVRKGMRFLILIGILAVVASCSPTYVEDNTLTFSAKDIYGEPVEIPSERFDGKVVMIDIWGAWCPPCLQQMPELIALQERYRDNGLEIIGVEYAYLYGEPRSEYTDGLREWIEEKGVNYTIVQGGEVGDEAELFPTLKNIKGYPTTIILARDGTIEAVKAGYAPAESQWYEQTIRRLLAERDLPAN